MLTELIVLARQLLASRACCVSTARKRSQETKYLSLQECQYTDQGQGFKQRSVSFSQKAWHYLDKHSSAPFLAPLASCLKTYYREGQEEISSQAGWNK